MAARSFTETFGTLYRASDLAAFLGAAFGDEGLPSQIADPDFTIRLATEDDRIIGFVQLGPVAFPGAWRSEAHPSELQSLMRISYAVFCLNKKKTNTSH